MFVEIKLSDPLSGCTPDTVSPSGCVRIDARSTIKERINQRLAS